MDTISTPLKRLSVPNDPPKHTKKTCLERPGSYFQPSPSIRASNWRYYNRTPQLCSEKASPRALLSSPSLGRRNHDMFSADVPLYPAKSGKIWQDTSDPSTLIPNPFLCTDPIRPFSDDCDHKTPSTPPSASRVTLPFPGCISPLGFALDESIRKTYAPHASTVSSPRSDDRMI